MTSRFHLMSSQLSPTFEAISCPGTPRRESMSSLQVTPHLTPSTSISSFVSSLDGEFDYRDMTAGNIPGYLDARMSLGEILGDEGDALPEVGSWVGGDERARVCYDIEQYLKSLEDVDYLDLSEPISPISLEGIKLGEPGHSSLSSPLSGPLPGSFCSRCYVSTCSGCQSQQETGN